MGPSTVPGMDGSIRISIRGRNPPATSPFAREGPSIELGFVAVTTRGATVLSIKQGGAMIEYEDEDPQIRLDFKTALEKARVPFRMPSLPVFGSVAAG